jgi:hypothetical protein
MAKKEESGDQFGIRVACAYVPAVVTAHVAAHWLPKAFVWGASIFLWLLVTYWIPPPSKMRFRRWLMIVTSLSILVWLLVKLQPEMY